ncbi:prolyl-tRNA synthetase [Diplocarpon rosae]|nr:prolyl-tRNA synthetase [Diplocarpon rosae]
MLPLGRRVQDKLEALIDKGASKLALSSISSEKLWAKSGRLDKAGAELFRFSDRKNAEYLLSPTHEEEITSLVSSTVESYKMLPVRLYQISRKYRDELRPRHGLLRSREFIMKDLYTFDHSPSLALATYHQVREMYTRLFDELKLPYLVAEADSGDIGGDLSHEFHFPTSKGEDHIISCSSCKYVANEELAESPVSQHLSVRRDFEPTSPESLLNVRAWRGISRDRLTLINVWYASANASKNQGQDASEINIHAIKAVVPNIDTSIDDALQLWMRHSILSSCSKDSPLPTPQRLLNVIDCRIPSKVQDSMRSADFRSRLPFLPHALDEPFRDIQMEFLLENSTTNQPLNLLRIKEGDPCPRCSGGSLKVQKAIELGHTFHLGTRYSEPLKATVVAPTKTESVNGAKTADSGTSQSRAFMQMGCHGIGVSRIVGAVADMLEDKWGLNWPRVMAPFEVLVQPAPGNDEAALEVYDSLNLVSPGTDSPPLDLVLDDRSNKPFAQRMFDADLTGYPVIVVVGKLWASERKCEVQCRRLNVKVKVHINELKPYIESLLSKI